MFKSGLLLLALLANLAANGPGSQAKAKAWYAADHPRRGDLAASRLQGSILQTQIGSVFQKSNI
jgi:hypothetical protein